MADYLEGYVTHYLFHNKENSYSIAKFQDANALDEWIITGYFPEFPKDVLYRFYGAFIKHPKYGQQYKVSTFEKMQDTTEEGIVAYLSSDFFHGIGPATAKAIYQALGPQCLDKILADKRVLEPLGLSKVKIERLYQALKDNHALENVLVKLYAYGLTSKMAMKLFNHYGNDTLTRIHENPYRLMDEVEGIGFKRADEIALTLGFDPEDHLRLKAALSYVLKHISHQEGFAYLKVSQLLEASITFLNKTHEVKEKTLETAYEELVNEKKVIVEEDRVYLTTLFMAEKVISEKIQAMLEMKTHYTTDDTREKLLLEALRVAEIKQQITYTKSQKDAIMTALTEPLSIITGGPGTGKTTVILGVLHAYAFIQGIELNNDMMKKVALMAPTGRAAKRMQEATRLEAYTIHRHLGYTFEGDFTYSEAYPLPQELIIIDEVSMVDYYLMKQLMGAILPTTQVIFVGDEDQLPSVGPGQILKDLLDANVIQTIRLKEIHRQAADSSIIGLSHAIKHGSLDDLAFDHASDVSLYASSKEGIEAIMLEQFQALQAAGYDVLEEVQVLIPMYKSDVGIDYFNRLLQATLNPKSDKFLKFGDQTFKVGDKVIQLINDPLKGVMNGDVGRVIDVFRGLENNQVTPYLVVDFDQTTVKYKTEELDELKHAYAISIHKSQGSEYKVVILPIARSYSIMLRRKLIYTAITRAKQKLIMIGELHLLKGAIARTDEARQTSLAWRLNQQKPLNKAKIHDPDIPFDELGEDLNDISPYDFMK